MLILLKLHFFSMSKNKWIGINTWANLDNLEGCALCQMICLSFIHQDKETEQLRQECIHCLCHTPVNKANFHCVALLGDLDLKNYFRK